jgi:hypothetical protein
MEIIQQKASSATDGCLGIKTGIAKTATQIMIANILFC